MLRVELVVCAILVPAAEMKRKWNEESKPALTLEELSVWAKVKLAPYKVWHIAFFEVFTWDKITEQSSLH